MSELERAETTGVLASLAAEINAEHRACEAAATTALEHAIRCGELLLEAKRRKPHGGWMAWVAANFEGSHDLANKYMRVARNSERVLNLLNEGRSISLRGALEEIKTAERRKRDAIALERRESAERVRTLSFAGDVEIHHCDFRGLELPDESVDMVFTDPPYPGEYLPLWKDLSHFAAKALKPGGVLIAYSGQYHLLEVMNNLAAELEYLWLGSLVFHGPKNAVQQTEVQNAFKPLLFYRRRGDAVATLKWSRDLCFGEGPDKEHHHWGQSIGLARHYIERLTETGGLVVDRFLGGGTTAAAAQQLGRRFIGCDVDWLSVAAAKERLAA